jgi:hypothetical protein
VDQARFVIGFRLLPKVANIDLNDVTLAAKVIPPDTIVDDLACQDLPGVAQEKL